MIGQFAWLTTGRILGALIQAAMFGLLAVLSGPEELGVVGATTGVLVVLQAACDLGVAGFVVRERAVEPGSPAIGAAIRLNRLTTVALVLLSLVALWLVTGPQTLVTFVHLAPLAVWAAAERNADTLMGIALADGRAQLNVGNLLGRRIIALGAFVVLTYVDVSPVLAYAAGLAIGSCASVVWANVFLGRLVPRSAGGLARVVRKAQPFWWNSVAVQLRNLDAAVVTVVAGTATAGLYSLASRLTVPLRLVPTALAGALLPHAARETDPAQRARTLRAVGLVVGAVSVVYVLLAALLPGLAGRFPQLDRYAGVIAPIQVLLLALPFAALASVLTSLLQAAGDAAYVARTAMLMSGLCLAGAALGAALAGVLGAACGFGFALVVQAAVLGARYVRSHLPRVTTSSPSEAT